MRGPLLEIDELAISIPTESGLVEAVRGVSLSIEPGETLGVVGESGSGKTMLALAVLGLQPRTAQVTGSIKLDGQPLGTDWQRIRGNRVAMVFQDPMTALNPMYTVGWQVAECIRLHRKSSTDVRASSTHVRPELSSTHVRARASIAARAVELLAAVGLPEPDLVARRYPHELSGGMRQRVVIAMAIANEPELLIADEPTTALDVTVQAQILDLLKSIRQETQAAMILISHDLGVVAGVADRVLVMYAGKAVEVGRVDDVFASPAMPYTAGLLASLPSLDQRTERLSFIKGIPPSGIGYGPGCAFAPRCPIAAEACAEQPPLGPVAQDRSAPNHWAACHFAGSAQVTPSVDQPETTVASRDGEVVVEVTNLVKNFRVRSGFRAHRTIQAVSGVDLQLRAGRCLALVGESGCGKSTLARLLVRLDEPTSGSIKLNGRELAGVGEGELRALRRQIQMVFQDPYSALNPRLSVGEIVGEPLTVHKVPDKTAKVRELLTSVGIDPAATVRFPGEFSGGQRQRIGIARALALAPQTIVLDEPVSALDVSIQASVLNLLRELQRDQDMAYLFIAHDLAVVRQVADDVAVMYLGKIVEQGPADEVYSRPAHPYTLALMSAVPVPDPPRERSRQRILLTGEVPSPANPPSGCRFRTRCWKATGKCATEEPSLTGLSLPHLVACHYPEVS